MRVVRMQVCNIVLSTQRVRTAPATVASFDGESARATRKLCLASCDVRAILVEVVGQLDLLHNAHGLPLAQQQALALQVLTFCCLHVCWTARVAAERI